MISQAPENKTLKNPAPLASRIGARVEAPPVAPSPEVLARLRAEFDALNGPDAGPRESPPLRRPIGSGECPKCRKYGEIFAEGSGTGRKLVYSACVCRKAIKAK